MIEHYRQLIKFRTLWFALVRRHLTARYRGSVLGLVWSLLNPLILMSVYTLVFNYYLRITTVEFYAIFLFTGLLPWLWATSALNEGTSSIVASGHLITKSLFPAQILPAVSVTVALLHFLLSLPLLVLFMVVAGTPLSVWWGALPLVMMLQAFFLYGVSVSTAALNVLYRDVQHLVANVLTLLFFLCPILYPVDAVPAQFKVTLVLNPLAVFTQLYHEILFFGVAPSLTLVGFAAMWAGITCLLGAMIFDRYREQFAELL